MSVVKKRNNRGFTLLELTIVVTIIGIISTSVTFSVRQFVVEKRSEEKVVAFWTELRSLKALAQKDNVPYLVKLTVYEAETSNSWYNVYKDVNKNYVMDSGEDDHYSSFLHQSNKKDKALYFGSPDDPNAIAFNKSAKAGGSAYNKTTAVQGKWNKDKFIGTEGEKPTENTIIFQPDNLGSINYGLLYIRNRAVPHIGYALVKAPNTNTIKLYKWNGSQWYEM